MSNGTVPSSVLGPNFDRTFTLGNFCHTANKLVLAACALLLLPKYGSGQGPCAIDLGPDQTICQGQTVPLIAPAGFPNYLWSTGSMADNITVGSSGVYWCQTTYPSGPLVTNGNFNGGNTAFTTQFVYNSNLNLGDGHYYIGANAASYHPQFFGTGSGNFMIVNSGWTSALFMAWCQDVVVCPGQTYTLTYRARTLSNSTPARLQWWINGLDTGPEETLPAFNAGWQTFTHTWTSPPGLTTATICLRAMSGEGVGNDFGLDDIAMSGTIVLTDDVLVNVTPLPVVDLGPNITLCQGQSLVLDAGVANGTYLWQDGSTNPGYTVTSAGDYFVTVSANGCSASDAIAVNYSPLPVVDLGPDLTLCSGQSTWLNVAQPGATYSWQNGSTASAFNVTAAGTYSVGVWLNGCFANDAVNVSYNPIPTVNLGPDQVICAGQQIVLNATTAGGTYLWQDGSTNATLNVNTSGTYSVDVTVNGCTGTDAVNVAVTPLPVVNLGPDQTVCPGTNVLLNATQPSANYLWQDGSTAATFTATQPGTYSVQVTVNGCSASDAMNIAHYGLPALELGPNVTICQGATTTIFANVPGASYLWSTGAVTSTITTGNQGIYWVDVTQNTCTLRDSVIVMVTPLPIVDLGVDVSICPGAQTSLNATTPGATYVWSTGATSATINAGPGNYSVQVTLNGCSSSDGLLVSTFPAAQVDLGPDTTLCPGQQLPMNVFQVGATYLWQNGSTLSNFTATSAGTYNVTLTTSDGCSANDAITVSYATPVAVNLGPDATLCQGDQITLNSFVPGSTYLWNTGAVTAAITVGQTGTYSVVVTQGNCSVSDAIAVQVVNVPVVDIGPDVTLCPGDDVVLDATVPGASYLWNTGSISPTLLVDQGGTYSVLVTMASGCTTGDAMTVAMASPGSVNLGPDLTLCQGNTVLLDAALPGASYLWSTGAVTPTITAGATGTYWVQVTQGSCVVGDTMALLVQPMPSVDLGANIALCDGESTVLDATYPSATYTWTGGSQAPTLTANTTGTYSVTVDLNGCTATDAVDVLVQAPPIVDLGPDITLCSGQQAVLDATTLGAIYTWSTGANSATIAVISSGMYWVQLSVGSCSTTDSINVQVQPMPSVDLGADIALCDGESTVLDATYPGATYTWTGGSQAPTLTASATGTYSVTVDLDGCTATDAVDLEVQSPPVVDLGPDITLCSSEQAVLDATTLGATYTWNTGATTPTLTVATNGTFWVQVDQGACTVSDTVTVILAAPGSIELGPDVVLCEGESLLLDATLTGATYLWSDGLTSATRTVTGSGTYSVTATIGPCAVSDAIQVTFTPLPIVDLGNDVDLCPGTTATFIASQPAASYVWHDGSTAAQFIASTAGSVSVTVTVNGCSSFDDALVSILEAPVADLGNDTTLCEGASLLLDVTQSNCTYLWDDGSTLGTRMVSSAGTFWVQAERNGCLASDTLNVELFIPAMVDLGQDIDLCPGETATLAVPIAGSGILWSTGATTQTITVSESGDYWVQVQVAACLARDTVNVHIVPLPIPDLGPDAIACDGDTLLLTIPPGQASVLWTNGSTADSILVTGSGNFGVTVEMDGCTATDLVSITMLEMIDTLNFGGTRDLCPGSMLLLDATIARQASYEWDTGVASPLLQVFEVGTYAVTVTGDCVSASGSIEVVPGNCDPLVFVPNAFSPNNDGINDHFLPVVNGTVERYQLEIYDRWGEQIYSTKDQAAGWNGDVSGTFAQDGVYVWVLVYRSLPDGGVVNERLMGHVTLLR